jgi:hypothetical protein
MRGDSGDGAPGCRAMTPAGRRRRRRPRRLHPWRSDRSATSTAGPAVRPPSASRPARATARPPRPAPTPTQIGKLTVFFSLTESSSGPSFAAGLLFRVREAAIAEHESADDDEDDGNELGGIHGGDEKRAGRQYRVAGLVTAAAPASARSGP